MTVEYALAVDAGNSKTVAVLADATGEIVGVGRAGGADMYAVGQAGARVALFAAINAAMRAASAGADAVVAACCCLAGVDWPEDRALWEARLAGALPRARRAVRNDGFALLGCLDPIGVGVAVTVGTGPAVAARDGDGREASLGFWCQDPLGGAGLGRRALRAVFLAEQGLGPPTSLGPALVAHFGAGDVAGLLHLVTRRGSGVTPLAVARAAPVVLACAAADEVARRVVADDAHALVDYLAPTAARAGLDLEQPWPVALGGSILGSESGAYRHAVLERLTAELPAAVPVVIRASPVLGALVGALALIDPELARWRRAAVLSAELPEYATATR
ncbi:MAG: hypothetical protein FWF28_03170 [Micrococcales bacterium]|nr:hypothetical protein [Micrococcales bacterium]